MEQRLTVISPDYAPVSPSPQAALMLVSARRAGIEPRFFGVGQAFTSWRKRLEDALALLPSLETSHVLMVDAYDTLFLRGEDAILNAFNQYNVPLLLSTEKDCWPDPERAKDYPPHESPWRFINGGGWMGERDWITYNLNSMLEEAGDSSNDQEIWTNAYLQVPIETPHMLDVHCRVFQSMSRSPEIVHDVNPVTGTAPCIFHYNGRTGGREELWAKLNR